jgi:hypothetical protein
MEENQVALSDGDHPNKTISRWQLLELIGLGKEAGLEGSQIRQIVAAEYGVDPQVTSRLLVHFTHKGYLICQPAPKKEGGKGSGNRKVFIRTDKENDLSDKPIPRAAALVEQSSAQSQETNEAIGAPNAQGPAAAHPAMRAKPVHTGTRRTATTLQPPLESESGPTSRRNGRRQVTEAAGNGSERQQVLLHSMQDTVDTHKSEVAAEGTMTAPLTPSQSVPSSAPAIPPISEEPHLQAAPVEPAQTSTGTPRIDDTPSLAPTALRPAVHDALSKAMDQFSDLLLLQVATKLGAFVAGNLAPLERATSELGSQIEAIQAKLEAITQQLTSAVGEKPISPKAGSSPSLLGDNEPASGRPTSDSRIPSVAGKGNIKTDRSGGKKGPKNLAGQFGNIRPAISGQSKFKALLIGVQPEQEHLIRERFGGQYDFLFLGTDAKYAKVRSIQGNYEIVLGLEEGCTPAIKDALKGHPHKAILPRSSQLMDELEEFFQLQLERSQS